MAFLRFVHINRQFPRTKEPGYHLRYSLPKKALKKLVFSLTHRTWVDNKQAVFLLRAILRENL
jgi:hypothetical protein